MIPRDFGLCLVVMSAALTVSSARFDLFGSLKWCSKFPDDGARDECKGTSGTLWMFSTTCCNVKFECVDGEYSQGLRCNISSSSQFCVEFPTDEPPIYCAGIEGPLWISSSTCCNVKFECLNGAYNQGFRCGTPGYVPDILQFKCIEEPRCVSENHPEEENQQEPPEIICCNGSDEYLPHPTTCNKYLQCNAGKLSIFECNAGTIFHYESQRCQPGNQETCEHSIVYV
ncbi:hypothetical protein pipiens_014077 [Culex pipiens pipiens]|uniref:Chitin-binding type-2 domain-containing protein n=1 Tax=Culex pipiens pipiens TaxID=38569 RepID=A0ABD1CVY7_CULPP